ncbi:hypothetical protein ACSBR1_028157 [Camellia fascicularis]
MYFNFFCNYSAGQVNFQTLEGTFQVNNINLETRKFVIEVKAKDRCGAKNSKPKYLQFSLSSPFNALNLCYGGMQLGNGNDVEFD